VAAAIFLIVVTIVGVRVHDALGLPDLRSWHRFVPPSEVRAREVGEKFNLEDYRRREERVFLEVRKHVVDGEPEGQGFNRYSKGSFSSAARFTTDWNRTFERVPARTRGGALLLHGLTDSPYSMRWLAKVLEEEGYYVLAPRMPGHGTVPAALLETDWQDWMAVAKMGARHVKSRIGAGKPFLIVGYSCGGGLAVKYSLDALAGRGGDAGLPRADRLILLSPLIGVDRLAGFTQMAALPGRLTRFEKARWLEVVPEYNPFKYNSFPAHAAQQTHDLTTALKAEVEEAVEAKRIGDLPPILTFQSVVDDTVTTRDLVTALYDNLAGKGGERSELVLFDVNRKADLQPFLTAVAVERPDWLKARRRSYRLTEIVNADPKSRTGEVMEVSTAPGAVGSTGRRLGLAWPEQMFSLSHVAVPFPACDPLYGPGTPAHPARELRFATLSPRAERKVLALPLANLMRVTWNPFYPYLEARIREAIGGSGTMSAEDPCG
jgi:alpha-beta hydrolase superfamily lysophospholipase